MVEHRNINPKTVIVCPKCFRKQLTITGHNRNAWHKDEESGAMIRQVYVSCPCTQHLLRHKETLEDAAKYKGKPGTMRLTTEVSVVDPVDL